MTAFYRVFINLFLLAIPCFRLTTGKKSKEQLQNILMHTFGHFSESKSEPAPLVLPWKRPATVIKYDDILTFTDESVGLTTAPLTIIRK